MEAVFPHHWGIGTTVGKLMNRTRTSIGSLIVEMEGGDRQKVDEAFLRALGEIVKGSERECFES